MTQPRPRYALIDSLRGLALANMIVYHGLWDLIHLNGVSLAWYSARPGFLWQQYICWSFLLLSGFCWELSRRPWKNGLIVSAAGLAVTLVTALAQPEETVWCGVLSFLGLAMLLMIPLHRVLASCPPPVGLLCSMALFVLTRSIPHGLLLSRFTLPARLYQFPFGFVLGFPSEGFYSSDYFPLLPWMFLYLAGYFLHRLLKSNPPLSVLSLRIPLLDTLGRHSLPFYLAHQPVLYALCAVTPLVLAGISRGPFS